MTSLVRAYLAAAALVVLLAACGHHAPTAPQAAAPSSTQPTSRARISILAPKPQQVLHTDTVHVKVRLTLTSPERPSGPQTLPGWLHLYLDGKITSIQPVPGTHSTLEHDLGHVRPGRHQLRAEFVQPNHLPWRPAVANMVVFIVRG